MLKIIGIVIVVLIVALLVIAAMKPDTFHLERQATIQAPPEKIFPLINDFHNWTSWSPWEKLDPALTRTYSGAPEGKGAKYAWKGKSQVGEGTMEITDATAPSRVAIQLHFIKPFEATNEVEFTLEGQGASTNVTWAMNGKNPFLSKVMQVFMSLDKMVGKDFESGLANLKATAEK
jgi:uncharacterized protein YndB with AHSA1/START domain